MIPHVRNADEIFIESSPTQQENTEILMLLNGVKPM